MNQQPPQTMLNPGTLVNYSRSLDELYEHPGLTHLTGKPQQGNQAQPQVFKADVSLLLKGDALLQEEVFGPTTIVIEVENRTQLAAALHGLQVFGAQPALAQRAREAVRRRHRILDGEVDTDPADRRHGVGGVTDRKQPRPVPSGEPQLESVPTTVVTTAVLFSGFPIAWGLALAVVFGLFSLLTLKTDEYPDVQPPIVAVAGPVAVMLPASALPSAHVNSV